MKKLLTVLLALTLLLAFAAPGLAADDGIAKAMQAYADIVKKAETYDYDLFKGAKFSSLTYQYALVDLKDGNGIPTLLLNLHNESDYGYFDNFRVFQYDAASRTVLAPTEVLTSGTGVSGGTHGGIGICDGKLGEQYVSMGQVTFYTYSIVGDRLQKSTLWTGSQFGQWPYKMEWIAWKETWDTSGFDAYQAPPAPAVVLSAQNLTVDGVSKAVEKYNIDGSNYFKLRDIAYLLNGTAAQFSVGWDAATGTVSIETGEPYTPNGSEMIVGADKSATAVTSSQKLIVDWKEATNLSVYNIGGNNYIKLRDLGSLLGFQVDYDAATNTAIIQSTDQLIGAHDAKCTRADGSVFEDGEYVVKYNDSIRRVQGGEVLSVKLLELARFTDEEVQAFLDAGMFPISEYSIYDKDKPITLWEKDENVALIDGIGGTFSLEKQDDGYWYLVDLDTAYQYKQTEDAELFIPDCIRIKDCTPSLGTYRNSFSDVINARQYSTPHNPLHITIKDGCVIVCIVQYHP